LPKQSKVNEVAAQLERAAAPVRPLWSGTITFGLVSIPVELLSAVRPRQTAMKLVDKAGHALGRQYHCSKEGKKLDNDDLVRGYETDSGKIVEITDEEFESVAPEMSGDIELRNFVPIDEIPPLYYQKPYFLAPAGKSAKAYHLLAQTMQDTGRVGIGSFVMRGHEYLVAIVSDNGVLRADTLRYADEIRSVDSIGLPKRSKATQAKVSQFVKVIDDLTRKSLDVSELEDKQAAALQALVKSKEKDGDSVIHTSGLESDDPEASEGASNVIDLMAVLRRSLSKNTVVTNAQGGPPISFAEHRAKRSKTVSASRKKTSARRKSPGSSRKKAGSARRKATRG
jgi:DNA end-binding protein Ku